MGNQGSLHKIPHHSDRSDSPYGHYEPPLSCYDRQEKPTNVRYFDQQMGNQPNLFNEQNNPQSYSQYPQQSMDNVNPNFYNTPKDTSIFNQRNRSPTRLNTEYPQPGPNQGYYTDNASFYSSSLQYQKAPQQPQEQPQQQQQAQQFQQQQQQQAQQQALLQQQQALFQQHQQQQQQNQQQQQQHQQQQQQRPQLEPQLQRPNPEPHQYRSHPETQQQPVQLHQLQEQQQKSVAPQLLDSRPKNPHESKPQFETNKFEQLNPNEALNSEMEQQGSFYLQQNQPFYLKQPESQYSQQVDKSRGKIPIPSNYTVQYHQGFAQQLQFTKSQCNEYYQNDFPNGNKPESGNFITQWYNDQGEIVQVANHKHDIPQIGLEQQPKDENELDEFRNMSPGSLERLYQNVPLCTMCSEKIQKHLDNTKPEEFNKIRGNMIDISQCRIRGRSPSPTKLKKKMVSPSIDDTVNKEKTELISLYETPTNYEFKPTPRRPNLGRSPSRNYLFSNPSLTKRFGYEAGKSMNHPSKEADNDKNSNNNIENSVSKNSIEDKCSCCGGWTLVRDQQNENGSKTNSPVREP